MANEIPADFFTLLRAFNIRMCRDVFDYELRPDYPTHTFFVKHTGEKYTFTDESKIIVAYADIKWSVNGSSSTFKNKHGAVVGYISFEKGSPGKLIVRDRNSKVIYTATTKPWHLNIKPLDIVHLGDDLPTALVTLFADDSCEEVRVLDSKNKKGDLSELQKAFVLCITYSAIWINGVQHGGRA